MTTVAKIGPLHHLLFQLQPGAPLAHGALTVVPLLGADAPGPDWLTLTEAGDAVTITEVSQAGSVPNLKVTNAADRPVLLLEGEELIGAKQNRVLNTTVLVAAGATLSIPVSCVEQGRWAWRRAGFVPSDASLFVSARARNVARVSESLRRGAGHQGDQREVWSGVAAFADAHGVESPTGAMHDVYRSRVDALFKAKEALAAAPGQVGTLVFVAGRWVGLELLASPGLFERAWPRLSTGYAIEAIGQPGVAEPEIPPAAILERLGRLAVEDAPAVGLGREHRLEGEGTHGAALVVDGRVAHMVAFPAPDARPAQKAR